MPILTKEQIIEAVFELPETERAEVLEKFSSPNIEFELTDEQKAEFERRIADHELHPEKSISRAELMAHLRAQA